MSPNTIALVRRATARLVLAALAGCGDDDTAPTTAAEVAPPAPKVARHVRLVARDFEFDPVDVTGEKEGLAFRFG